MDEEGNFISEEETSFMDEEGVKRFLTGSQLPLNACV